MEFLWKRESGNRPLYRDLFLNIENDFPCHNLFDMMGLSVGFAEKKLAKNNKYSSECRLKGNEKFGNGKLNEAIELYNKSLCFAGNNTENVALAYANRSACFFNLKMYRKCLNDIALAEQSNFPERLKSKLEKRKSDCLKLLQSEPAFIDHKFEMKLSWDADENFPFMANILEIKKNDEFGRHITSKCDIPAGKTVFIDENFVTRTKSKDKPLRCVTCNRVAINAIACTKCTVVMFCNVECMDQNKVHKMDCGAFYNRSDDIEVKYVVQSILTAVNMFPSVECLMEFVEDAVASEKYEIPESARDQRSKYRMFLKLYMPHSGNFIQDTYKVYKTIMRLDEVGKLFHSKLKQRFLMHLVAHHFIIILFNSFDSQMCVFVSLFSHSCIPNIQEIWIDNGTACITIRPIKKGEQLYLSYMSEDVMKSENFDLKTELQRKYGFVCKCAKCKGQLANYRNIERDDLFLEIDNIGFEVKNKDVLWNLIKKCIKLLNKYKNLRWSTQLQYVSQKLGMSLGISYEL